MLQELLLLLLLLLLVGGWAAASVLLLWRLATVSWRKNLFIIEHSCVCISFSCFFLLLFICFSFFIHVGTTWRKWCVLATTKVHHAKFIVTHTVRNGWQQTNRWCSTNGQNNDTTTTKPCERGIEFMPLQNRNSNLFVRARCLRICVDWHSHTVKKNILVIFSRECARV